MPHLYQSEPSPPFLGFLRSLLCIIVLLVPLASLPIPTSHAASAGLVAASPVPSGPSVSIWNPIFHSGNLTSPNLGVGSLFTVSVNVTSAPSFDYYSVRLEYNPTILELMNTSLQGTISYPNITFSNLNTFLDGLVLATVQGSTSVSGSGVLLYLQFKVLLVSISNLSIIDTSLLLAGQSVAHLRGSGCFNNRSPRQVAFDFSTSPAPGYHQTSEYMAGKVAVGIILPESQGPDYNWTDAEAAQTVNGVEEAMSWWASQDPVNNLTFYYDVHIRASTVYEPIEMAMGQQTVWIADVMNRLGYLGDAYSATLAYVNGIREANHTDWAFTVFVADSNPSVNYGNFAGGGYADALIGGPWMVMSRMSNYAFNSGQYYPAVPAHETGHIFGATDEYLSMVDYSGYLLAPDAPGNFGIMNQNSLHASTSTEAQVGHIDCNGDGVSDLVETKPAIMLNQPSGMVAGPSTQVSGKAEVVPYPDYRFGGANITVSKIANVEYSLDQGSQVPTTATDGSFDQPLEGFSFNLTNLAAGTHRIDVTAITSAGVSTGTSFTVTVPTVVGTARFAGWAARPQLHHLDLSTQTIEVFLADVNVSRAPVHVYVQFLVRNQNGSAYTVLSEVVVLAPGATVIQAKWQPPDATVRYFVEATLFYSAVLTNTNSSGWIMAGTKDFTFNTFLTPS